MPVRAASVRKQELRRTMLMVPVAHRAAVGRAAARENHELGTAFRAKAARNTFPSFRVAARGMQLEAETNKEVLVKHGLSESVLEMNGRNRLWSKETSRSWPRGWPRARCWVRRVAVRPRRRFRPWVK